MLRWQGVAGAAQQAAEAGRALVRGSQERVVFQLHILMDKLEATFDYESPGALPLAILSVQVSAAPNVAHSEAGLKRGFRAGGFGASGCAT